MRSASRFILWLHSAGYDLTEHYLVASQVLSWLDYGNMILARIPSYLVQRLQSVMNVTARLSYCSSRYEHVTLLLSASLTTRLVESGWSSSWLSFVAHRCLHGLAPACLANELLLTVCELWHLSTSTVSRIINTDQLIVCLSTVGDRAFPVAATRICNCLPQHVTSSHCPSHDWKSAS